MEGTLRKGGYGSPEGRTTGTMQQSRSIPRPANQQHVSHAGIVWAWRLPAPHCMPISLSRQPSAEAQIHWGSQEGRESVLTAAMLLQGSGMAVPFMSRPPSRPTNTMMLQQMWAPKRSMTVDFEAGLGVRPPPPCINLPYIVFQMIFPLHRGHKRLHSCLQIRQ